MSGFAGGKSRESFALATVETKQFIAVSGVVEPCPPPAWATIPVCTDMVWKLPTPPRT